jgi:hypothetical protein
VTGGADAEDESEVEEVVEDGALLIALVEPAKLVEDDDDDNVEELLDKEVEVWGAEELVDVEEVEVELIVVLVAGEVGGRVGVVLPTWRLMSLPSPTWGTADTWAARSDKRKTLARLYIFFFLALGVPL